MSLNLFTGGRRNGWLLLTFVLPIAVVLSIYFVRIHRSSAAFKEDDLSRAEAWTAFGGTWVAQRHEIENTSEERGAKLMTRLNASQDYQVEGDLQIVEPYGEAGFVLRSSGEEEGVDAYHGYFAGVRTIDSSFEFGRTDFGWHPIVRRSLPANADLRGWIHLRVVAVGCSFGTVVTLSDGIPRAAFVQDESCLSQGHFGLRSIATGARWKNLHVALATEEDINLVQALAQGLGQSENLPVSVVPEEKEIEQYESSMKIEAKRHALQEGVQPIVDFLMSPGSHPDITIQGVVVSTPPLTIIQDDTGALIVPNVDPKLNLTPGDVVAVRGTLVSSRFRSVLEASDIRVLWTDMPVPPLAVTASQLTGGTYRGRAIEVEGTVVSIASQGSGYDLILRDRNLLFRGLSSTNFQLLPVKLEVGSRLRIRGAATSLPQFTNNVFPFAVIIDHVEVVGSPPWWSPRHLIEMLLLCAGGLLCIQWAFHRLQQWHMESTLKEREQLAFEMHDTLAQSFTGIAFQLKAASLEQRGEKRVREHVKNALEMVHLSHKEASQTIAALRPQFRDAVAVLNALRELAERLSDGGPPKIAVSMSGKNTRLPVQVMDALFRIGQEAISNAIQHAGCTLLTIQLVLSKRQAQLCVRDNGEGRGEDDVREGLGITGMRTRADKIKAQFMISGSREDGTSVCVTAPLPIAGGLFISLRALLEPIRKRRHTL